VSELLAVPGAVEADAPDGGVAAHYGSWIAEQRALIDGQGFVDLSNRDVIALTGPDRLTLLHALSTQDFESLQPGVQVDALVLSPQGHIEHGFSAVDGPESGVADVEGAQPGGPDTLLAHTEPGGGAPLVAFLEGMKFMSRVDIAERPDLAVIGLPGLGWRLVGREDLPTLPDSIGAPVGLLAWEALRIAAGRPRIGLDTDHRTIPNEVGLLNVAVHLDKGCYRGQETVARVHTLGRPPRRLVLLHLDGSAERLPERGSTVEVAGSPVGFVGTSARHHELGPIALALVKRNVDPGTPLVVDGIAASQETLVDPDVGLHVRPALGRVE
jgi:folate-binding protein YgfZ